MTSCSISGDLGDDRTFAEDEAVAIYASYSQARRYLHKRKLGRGFFRQSLPKGKSKGPEGFRKGKRKGKRNVPRARLKRWTKTKLMRRSICARCGKKGHWVRDCKIKPDERGRRRQAGFGGFQAGSVEAEATLRMPVARSTPLRQTSLASSSPSSLSPARTSRRPSSDSRFRWVSD